MVLVPSDLYWKERKKRRRCRGGREKGREKRLIIYNGHAGNSKLKETANESLLWVTCCVDHCAGQ